MLENELNKIHDFQKTKTTELARRITTAESDVMRLVKEEESYRSKFIAPEPGSSQGAHRNELEAERLLVSEDREENVNERDLEEGLIMDDDSDIDAKSESTFEEQFRWLEEEVATLVADVHDLALYSKLNLTGFMKMFKMCSHALIVPSCDGHFVTRDVQEDLAGC